MAFEEMISVDRGDRRFGYRAAAVILDPSAALTTGRVLLQGVGDEVFWCLPGGRVEMGETAAECLERELREELGEEARIERLLWVVENFFKHEGVSWHEIGLYFLASLAEGSRLLASDEPLYGVEPESGVRFRLEWHRLSALDGLRLYPSFLTSRLRALPEHAEHVVHRDE